MFIIFSAIGLAYETLTVPEKRKQYDLSSSDEECLEKAQSCNHEYNNTHEFEGNYYIKLTMNCRHYYFQHHVMSINS